MSFRIDQALKRHTEDQLNKTLHKQSQVLRCKAQI